MFVTTKDMFCHDKPVFCHDKHMFVVTFFLFVAAPAYDILVVVVLGSVF